MEKPLRQFRDDYLGVLLRFLWREWTAVGVAGQQRVALRHVVDPEALLLFTCSLGRYDQRLFREGHNCGHSQMLFRLSPCDGLHREGSGALNAEPKHLYRKFIETGGHVRLDRRAHNPIIAQARLDQDPTPMRWLAGKTRRITCQ